MSVVKMCKKHLTLKNNSTFYDMFGEYLLFIREVFPKVKEICQKHDINVSYEDAAFSVPKEEFNRKIILQDLRVIDNDRTIFICFRGQKVGWRPCPDDIDKNTVDEYPELVDFIGNVSITELAVMHALKPFNRCVDGELTKFEPVKHALFYFRNPGYLKDINNAQKIQYVNKSNGLDKSVLDMEIAKAKDLIFETKNEFDSMEDFDHNISITPYDARWDRDLNIEDLLIDYCNEYEKLHGESLDYFIGVHKQYLPDERRGGLCDFTHESRLLKYVMIEDIINAIKLEFPENFIE